MDVTDTIWVYLQPIGNDGWYKYKHFFSEATLDLTFNGHEPPKIIVEGRGYYE